jgi:hypothetical protein
LGQYFIHVIVKYLVNDTFDELPQTFIDDLRNMRIRNSNRTVSKVPQKEIEQMNIIVEQILRNGAKKEIDPFECWASTSQFSKNSFLDIYFAISFLEGP